jgi:DNA-binding transcriptional ArsR family regulator
MSFWLVPRVECRVFASSTEKLVMLKLALCGNDDGDQVRPSVWTIASDTQLSERTVQRVLNKLVDNGLLTITREEDPRNKLPKVYKIDLSKLGELPLTEAAQARLRRKEIRRERKKSGSERVIQNPGTGDIESTNGCRNIRQRVTQSPPTGDTVSPNSLEEPLNDPLASDGVSARRRGAAPTDDRPAGSEAEEGAKPAQASELWMAKQAELEVEIGDKAYRAWLTKVVPIADDGTTYTLAAPTDFIRDYVTEKLAEAVGRVINRSVTVVKAGWAAQALTTQQRRFKETPTAAP